MEYSQETRRYLAKVSRIGMVAAILYALIHGLFRYFEMCALGGITFPFRYLFGVGNSLIPEATVAVAGLLGLVVCGILSAAARNKPAVAETGWIIAGKITLLSAPVGYIHSLFGLGQMVVNAASFHKDFLFSFATLAAVFVGYALGARGISMEQTLQNTEKKLYIRRVLRNTAIVLGVMLASFLLMLGRTWMTYREIFQGTTRLGTLLSVPLLTTLPVALAVTVGYPLLSLAARWDEAPSKGRFGKGTILLCWVTLGVNFLCRGLSILIDLRLLHYDAGDLMGGLNGLQRLQDHWSALSTVATLLGIWTLCGILSRVKESKAALWGARGLLGVIVLRNLFSWILDATVSIIQMKKQSSGVGIIGGADFTTAVITAKVESWVNLLYTLLSIAALVVLTVGLTRRCRVSKAFWTVPALTAASILTSLLVSIVWELVLRSTNTDSALTVSVVNTVIVSVITIARSLIGVLALTRTPAEEVPPPPTATEGEEPPKPRVEDYLYQL